MTDWAALDKVRTEAWKEGFDAGWKARDLLEQQRDDDND